MDEFPRAPTREERELLSREPIVPARRGRLEAVVGRRTVGVVYLLLAVVVAAEGLELLLTAASASSRVGGWVLIAVSIALLAEGLWRLRPARPHA